MRLPYSLLVPAFLFFTCSSLVAGTLDVPADYTTIQAAIDASTDGDTILVSPGTYHENLDFAVHDVALISTGGPAVTIIDGDSDGDGFSDGRVVQIAGGQTSTTVIEGFTIRNGDVTGDGGGIYIQGADPTIRGNEITGNAATRGGGIFTSLFDGVIEDNQIQGNGADYGAGILLYDGPDTAVVQNNTITANQATIGGGGVYIYLPSISMIGNTIENNAAPTGAGIYIYKSSPTVEENVITGNNSSGGGVGGGIYTAYGNPTIRANDISNNSAGTRGGGICTLSFYGVIEKNRIHENTSTYGAGILLYNGTAEIPVIQNNAIFGNEAITGGGGIYVYLPPVLVANNVVYGNGSLCGGGIYNQSGNGAVVRNCIVWGNTAGIGPNIYATASTSWFHNDLEDDSGYGLIGLNGNISLNPLFTDAPGGDFHISPGSPCIDAGQGTSDTPPVDFEGDPRTDDPATVPNTGTGTPDYVDIGMDEYVPSTTPPDCTEAVANPDTSWPPNHKFILLEVLGVTDPDGDSVTITITNITQDEPVVAEDIEDPELTCPDGLLVDVDGDGNPEAAGVRCERSGGSNGRVYTIHFTATDDEGASSNGSVTFCVPKSRSSRDCVDDGQLYDSMPAVCPDTGDAPEKDRGSRIYTLDEFQTVTPDPLFLRADANWDEALDIGDGILMLQTLFMDSYGFDCPDAADVNDDGFLDISDAIGVLYYLFAEGPTPPQPSGVIGPDPTADELGCP